MTLPRAAPLRPPKAPNLLVAPVDYRQQYIDQLTNALRLYFNQIDNGMASLLSPAGGGLLQFPNGAFFQDGSTLLTAAMTNVSTTDIQVVSTADFVLTTGGLVIGTELISYTGKTATSFTGITRGVFGSTKAAHSIGNAETAEKKQLRLQIAGMTANTIKSGMQLMGIRVPERM